MGCLHIMGVTPYSKRKTALDGFLRAVRIGALQGAAREHCFLCAVECDRSKLLPVADKLVFHYELVYSQFTLVFGILC